MNLKVIGCHGGETPRHRTSAFVLDGKLCIDAGSLTSGMELEEQFALEACLVSHAHLDHVRDLATIADNRSQAGCGPLLVAGTKPTISVLRKHFFNGLLWPDFSKIPDEANAAIVYKILKPEEETLIAGYSVRAILVNHTIDCSAFIVKGPMGTIAYSGDTGPTDRLYEILNQEKDVRALLMEVSFPNSEARLARVSGHHTPETLAKDLQKLVAPKEIPTLLYHIKPCFQAEVERECAALKGLNLTVMGLGDKFRF